MKEKIFVTKSSMPKFEDYLDEIKDLWKSCSLTNMGVKHQELEKKLTQYLKVKQLELTVNGHMALELSLQSIGVKGEVITTPFTFISTTHSIVRTGNTPVFCDINPIDFTIDVDKIEQLITDKTVAIMPVHVYGNICNVDKIQLIADKYNIKVIYDSAHAFGVEYNGKGIGSYGDMSCYSFHATKVFNTVEGGAISVNNIAYLEKIKLLRNFGIKNINEISEVGTNAKMNEFSACMGLCNIKSIDFDITKRGIIAKRYRENLKDVEGLQFNPIQNEVHTNYAYFPVIFDENILGFSRDDVLYKLSKEDIFARKYFYPLANEIECYNDKYIGETPVARLISNRVLTLPIYPDLSLDVVDMVCDIIKNN